MIISSFLTALAKHYNTTPFFIAQYIYIGSALAAVLIISILFAMAILSDGEKVDKKKKDK